MSNSRGIYINDTDLDSTGVTSSNYFVKLRGCDLTDNHIGMLNDLDPDICTIDAACNWWGDASGPYNDTTNSDATGDEISDGVIFSPWLGATPDTTPMTYQVDDRGPVPTAGYIQTAVDAAAPGDLIEVAPGLYEEQVTIAKSLTLRGATYTINKNGYTIPSNYVWDTDVESVIQAVADETVMTITADDVTVEGFVVQALDRTITGTRHLIEVQADGHGKDLENIEIVNNIIGPNTNTTDQMGTKGRMNLYIALNQYQEQPWGLLDSRIAGNKIYGSEGNGNAVFIWGAYYDYGARYLSPMTGTVIEDNEICEGHRSGIEIAGGVSDLVIRDNTIYDFSSLTNDGAEKLKYGSGILVIRGSSDKTNCDGLAAVNLSIEYNEIKDCEKNAIYFGPRSRHVNITHNDLYDNGWDGVRVDLIGNYWNPDFETWAGPYTCLDGSWNINIHSNNITGNSNGTQVIGDPTNGFVLDATENWWGNNSGPFNTTWNAYALGDAVNGSVAVVPWTSHLPESYRLFPALPAPEELYPTTRTEVTTERSVDCDVGLRTERAPATNAEPVLQTPMLFLPVWYVFSMLSLVGVALFGRLRGNDWHSDGDDDGISPVVAIIIIVGITVALSGVLYIWVTNTAREGGMGRQNAPTGIFELKNSEESLDEYHHDQAIATIYLTEGEILISELELLVSPDGDEYYAYEIHTVPEGNPSKWEAGETLIVYESDTSNWPSDTIYCRIVHTPTDKVIYSDTITIEDSAVDTQPPRVRSVACDYPTGREYVKNGDEITVTARIDDDLSGVNASEVWIDVSTINSTNPDPIKMTAEDGGPFTCTIGVDKAIFSTRIHVSASDIEGNRCGWSAQTVNVDNGETFDTIAHAAEYLLGAENTDPATRGVTRTRAGAPNGTWNWNLEDYTAGINALIGLELLEVYTNTSLERYLDAAERVANRFVRDASDGHSLAWYHQYYLEGTSAFGTVEDGAVGSCYFSQIVFLYELAEVSANDTYADIASENLTTLLGSHWDTATHLDYLTGKSGLFAGHDSAGHDSWRLAWSVEAFRRGAEATPTFSDARVVAERLAENLSAHQTPIGGYPADFDAPGEQCTVDTAWATVVLYRLDDSTYDEAIDAATALIVGNQTDEGAFEAVFIGCDAMGLADVQSQAAALRLLVELDPDGAEYGENISAGREWLRGQRSNQHIWHYPVQGGAQCYMHVVARAMAAFTATG